MLIIDLSFSYEHIDDPRELLSMQAASSGHLRIVARSCQVHVIRFLKYDGEMQQDGVHYHFFNHRSGPWLPLSAPVRDLLKRLKPDVVITHGLYFPLPQYSLRKNITAPVIVQFHGGGLPGRFMRLLNAFFRPKPDACIFTSRIQAGPWMANHLLPETCNVYELMEGSTDFRKGIKLKPEEGSGPVFLWVGRLDSNKDPLLVLKAFEDFLKSHPSATLQMIFHEGSLEEQVRETISSSLSLSRHVILRGKIAHTEMQEFYSAADFFILASSNEGSGYALCEAMACGCIPVVSNIPSFRYMLGEDWPLFFEPRNGTELLQKLLLSQELSYDACSKLVSERFSDKLSFDAIAKGLLRIVNEVLRTR